MSISGLREARPPKPVVSASVEKTEAKPIEATHEPSPFAKLVAGLGNEVNQGERTMMKAMHASGGQGGGMGPEQLLALQAGVYRYSEAVDLAAKLVDRASNGLKTVVQGQ